MAHRIVSVVLGLVVVAAVSEARAGCAPAYVIPGKSGVPVVINNYDARWMVVEGDCGLSRPGHTEQTVIGGRYVGPIRGEVRRSGYYPTSGEKPPQGRHEIEPPADRQLPPPAENFSRSWSSAPQPVEPADLPNPNAAPTGEGGLTNPPVIVVPQFGPGRRQH
jgi:hypothetical protein